MSTTSGAGRTRILRAARGLFLDRGFADVSMQQIADDAAITKATLYHHFRDKEDLFVEVVRREHERIGQELEALIAGATALEEQLRRIAVTFFEGGEGDFGRLTEDLYRHVSEERYVSLYDELHRDASSPEGVIRACFVWAMESGEIAPLNPDLLATLFFSMLHGLRWVSDYTPSSPTFTHHDAALLPHLLLHGIATKPGMQNARLDTDPT
ncbi:MAG: TetR/AcrR family transcriptional regulator [Thermomicrobiales bacterium]